LHRRNAETQWSRRCLRFAATHPVLPDSFLPFRLHFGASPDAYTPEIAGRMHRLRTFSTVVCIRTAAAFVQEVTHPRHLPRPIPGNIGEIL
jgi:hypothetical protein